MPSGKRSVETAFMPTAKRSVDAAFLTRLNEEAQRGLAKFFEGAKKARASLAASVKKAATEHEAQYTSGMTRMHHIQDELKVLKGEVRAVQKSEKAECDALADNFAARSQALTNAALTRAGSVPKARSATESAQSDIEDESGDDCGDTRD